MSPQQIYDAFEEHARSIKGKNLFGRSKLTKSRSSLRRLFATLDSQLKTGIYTALDFHTVETSLRRHSPNDHKKYLPAVRELCRAWPKGDYHEVQIIRDEPLLAEPQTVTAARSHGEQWTRIEVTDIPTNKFGVYNHTANDSKTTTQKATASGQVLGMKIEGVTKDNVLTRPEYWVSLGRLVFVSNAARCFGCAAAVVYTYCYENRRPDLWLEVVGSKYSDHHFVVVGRENADIHDVENWGDQAYVVDVWQSNLAKGDISATLRPSDCRYVGDGSGLVVFCSISPEWRKYLYQYARKLGSFREVVQRSAPVVTEEVSRATPTPRVQPQANPFLAELRARQQRHT